MQLFRICPTIQRSQLVLKVCVSRIKWYDWMCLLELSNQMMNIQHNCKDLSASRRGRLSISLSIVWAFAICHGIDLKDWHFNYFNCILAYSQNYLQSIPTVRSCKASHCRLLYSRRHSMSWLIILPFCLLHFLIKSLCCCPKCLNHN